MDPEPEQLRSKILEALSNKVTLKQRVFDNTFAIFNDLKEALHELSTEIDEELDEKIDRRIRIEYRDRGKFEAQVQIADDLMIFSMQTDVFQFSHNHTVWNNPYVKENRSNAYCGVINIYNFLSDSFKYNRATDEGYLIGRIFINHQMQYFVEGKRQESLKSDKFGTRQIDREAIIEVLETAIYYSLGFDLLVPPYEAEKTVSVEQFNAKTEHSKFQIGKRLGYDFRCDDVE